MKQDTIIFNLNSTEKIIFESEDSFEQMHSCQDAAIFFVADNHKYLLSHSFIRENLYRLTGVLSEALNNRLKISTPDDVGYLYNEHLYDRAAKWDKNKHPHGLCTSLDESEWIGYKYYVWGYDYQAWIYNDVQGNIILELTPVYL